MLPSERSLPHSWLDKTFIFLPDDDMRINSNILERIDQTGGKIMFASATFELVGLPKIEILDKQKKKPKN